MPKYAPTMSENMQKYVHIVGMISYKTGTVEQQWVTDRRNCAEVNMLKWPTHEAYKVTPKGTVTVTNITWMNTYAAEYELSE